MSCACHNSPCAPAPFRCECQRDCWVGPPEDYATCIAACDPECGFPDLDDLEDRGLAYLGYRCASSTYDDCIDDCTADFDTANTACDDALTTCQAGCVTEECFNECASVHCECYAAALAAQSTCNTDCVLTIGLAAWTACAQAAIDYDADCCNTTLGDCLGACDTSYLEDMQTAQAAWFSCVDDCQQIYFDGYFFDVDGCNNEAGVGACLELCDVVILRDTLTVEADRVVCRATCERAEIDRVDPEDRKKAECGGRYHLCRETCKGAWKESQFDCLDDQAACLALCDPDELVCAASCRNDFLDCKESLWLSYISCRVDCCYQEHAHADNERVYDPCYFDCYSEFYTAKKDCSKTFNTCAGACLPMPAGAACVAACTADLEECNLDAEDDFDLCLASECADLRKDCPLCVVEALEDAEDTPPTTSIV